jgi:DinB superfamily
MSGYVCPECGLDYDTISPSDAAAAVRSYPRRFRAALASPDDSAEAVRRRPAPGVWSALEYACHVADLLPLFAEVVQRTTTETNPSFDFPDPDEQVERDRCNEQDPSAVLDRLQGGADRLAEAIDAVDADAWTRTATFPWGERDALTMSRNAVHEGHHHLRDIERGLSGTGSWQ